jgi:hypothetical protein
MFKRLLFVCGVPALVIAGIFFLKPAQTAHAQVQNPACTPGANSVCATGIGPLGGYNTAWYSNQVGTWISGDSTLVNPAACSDVTDGYETSTTDASMLQSAMLGALLGGKKVQFIVQGCTLNRPQIIAVYVQP